MFNKLERLEDLQHGDVLLTRVRKVHSYAPNATKDHAAYKIQAECAEFIVNEFRPLNATSLFNEGDSRFVGQKPRRGWVNFEPSQWVKFFGDVIPIEAIEKLQFSSTSQKDVAKSDDQIEGTHFITVNLLNPSIKYGGQDLFLHVRITESLVQRNPQQPPKINPRNNEVQTQNEQPIFVTSVVDFGRQKSIFLLSDQMYAAVKGGMLTFSPEVMEKYHLSETNIGIGNVLDQKMVKAVAESYEQRRRISSLAD